MEYIRLTVEGPIAVVTIHRPACRNALNSQVYREIIAALQDVRDREDVLNVFLYADQADKLAYAMDTYGDRPEEAEQRVRQVDASRESYYHYLTRAKWGDLKRYHLSLNTSPIGKEGGADLIVQYAKLRRAKLGL